jgi:hypothetical protein
MKKWIAAGTLALGLLTAAPALAWDPIGHQVVARIAWENMTPRARAAAVALLTNAPADAGLRELYPATGVLATRDRTFFVKASTWPDLVRATNQPARRRKYNHSPWHYVNYSFELDPQGPRERTDLVPDTANIVNELGALEGVIANTSHPSEQRAVDLAWVLHLVGDVHQPLHATDRVAPGTKKGDSGGNAYLLNGSTNLHGYWDSAITRNFHRQSGESEAAYVSRIARTVQQRHPQTDFTSALAVRSYESWARDGLRIAENEVYLTPAGAAPSAAYKRATYRTAELSVALAGYRLAALLNRTLGGSN